MTSSQLEQVLYALRLGEGYAGLAGNSANRNLFIAAADLVQAEMIRVNRCDDDRPLGPCARAMGPISGLGYFGRADR